jgi:hypothetical protein
MPEYIGKVAEAIEAKVKGAAIQTNEVHDPKEGLIHELAVVQTGGRSVLVRVNVPLTRDYSSNSTVVAKATPVSGRSIEVLLGEAPGWEDVCEAEKGRMPVMPRNFYSIPEIVEKLAEYLR